MKSWWLYPPVVLAAVVQLPAVLAWSRPDCLAKIQNGSYSPIPAYYNASNPILTLEECYAICDPKMGLYPDIGPRLVEWLLPIILLVVNMQFAPDIGIERFLMILHLMGDPVHSMWSLLSKVEDWKRSISDAEVWCDGRRLQRDVHRVKDLAIIASVAREFIEPSAIDDIFSPLTGTNEEPDAIWQDTADALRSTRTNEILRTLFATVLYIFQVVSAFVPAVGNASSPSGGKIGPTMLLSWLLPAVLLSNAVGDMSSRRNCKRIIEQFLSRIGKIPNARFFCADKPSRLLRRDKEDTPYFQSLAWSGGIYTYCPSNRLWERKGALLALLALIPVSLASGIAFAVLYTAPSYFSCRHILVIGAYALWIVSAILTSALSLFSDKTKIKLTGKYLYRTILIKDGFIALPILALIIASSCGLWNNCYCWSGALILGKKATVQLNPSSAFDRNNSTIYPAIVGTGLFLQVVVFAVMVRVSRTGFRVMLGKSVREVQGPRVGNGGN